MSKITKIPHIEANVSITRLFKPYIVKRDNGQCQILIPLIELDGFVDRICQKVGHINPATVCFELCKYLTSVVIEGESCVYCNCKTGCPLHDKENK